MPPRWIVEPSDVSVERNRHVALHCQAQGVPTPTIVWKKATGKTIATLQRAICSAEVFFASCYVLVKSLLAENPREARRDFLLIKQVEPISLPLLTLHLLTGSKAGDYEELRERTYTKILSNGTLLLQHVKEDREGFYLCHASNGIGSGLGKVVQLKVNCE